MTVALLGAADDPQVRAVRDAVTDRGTEAVVWDSDRWPGEAPLEFAVTEDGVRATVEDAVPVDDLTAVYFRRLGFDPRGPEFDGDLEERPYSLVNQLREYRGLLMSVLRYLDRSGVDVVNPPEAMSIHGLKPLQTAVLEDADVPVPSTLATNDPERVAAFHDRHDEVVYKPVGGGGHARRLTSDDLAADRLDRLANAPVQFQERLPGTDHRLFVVDGSVVATGRIETDEIDYRLADHDVTATTVDERIEDAAVRAAEALGLRFAGVDAIVGEDGSYGVLEANPSPMFATFDRRAGTDVADHLAAALVR